MSSVLSGVWERNTRWLLSDFKGWEAVQGSSPAKALLSHPGFFEDSLGKA